MPIDPKDPAYKKARKKVARLKAALTVTAMMTDDEDDDLLVEIMGQIIDERFDEVYEILNKKRNAR